MRRVYATETTGSVYRTAYAMNQPTPGSGLRSGHSTDAVRVHSIFTGRDFAPSLPERQPVLGGEIHRSDLARTVVQPEHRLSAVERLPPRQPLAVGIAVAREGGPVPVHHRRETSLRGRQGRRLAHVELVPQFGAVIGARAIIATDREEAGRSLTVPELVGPHGRNSRQGTMLLHGRSRPDPVGNDGRPGQLAGRERLERILAGDLARLVPERLLEPLQVLVLPHSRQETAGKRHHQPRLVPRRSGEDRHRVDLASERGVDRML